MLALIALAARAAAAPATAASIAEAVRYADILTGADAEVARRAPDDPDDQRAGTSSDDEDDEDDEDDDPPGSFGDTTGARGGSVLDDDDDDDDANDVEARADERPGDRADGRRPGGDATNGADGDIDTDVDPGGDDVGVGLAEHAGELALLDDEPVGAAAITSDEAGFLAPAAGAVERYEARMRRRRSWILGRLDVGLAWRRRESEPMHAMAYISNEVWLLATWRR